MKRTTSQPPLYFFLALVGILGFNIFNDHFSFTSDLLKGIGLMLAFLGFIINIIADNHFKRIHTTVKHGDCSAKLATGGIFEYSRNPMYFGMVLFLVGLSLFLDNYFGLLFSGIFAILLQRLFISKEEKMLTERFGVDYISYMKRVRRWI